MDLQDKGPGETEGEGALPGAGGLARGENVLGVGGYCNHTGKVVVWVTVDSGLGHSEWSSPETRSSGPGITGVAGLSSELSTEQAPGS